MAPGGGERSVMIVKAMSFRLVLVSFLVLFVSGCGGAGSPGEKPSPVSFVPETPPAITRSDADTIRVDLDASMHDIALAAGVLYHAWTFNNHVPGPFIRARTGDILQVAVTNSDPTGMLHNVDFHAVMGPGGGADVTNVAPGQRRVGTFKLLSPGLFVYHCATRPMTAHIANGMYGMILVEPERPLPPVDREYAVMQSEFYTTPRVKDSAFVEYSPENGLREDPQYVVFNGAGGALMGDHALKARVGERLRIYFGNIGPNKISSFHIVGLTLDRVYREGDLESPPGRFIQTTLVPAGGAVVVEVTPKVPGTYTLLDHSMFRTEKGAMGQLVVEGSPQPGIYSGQ
jgi:copper-containing nitrite reductase